MLDYRQLKAAAVIPSLECERTDSHVSSWKRRGRTPISCVIISATEKVAGQLYAAVASISANLGEGYSRSFGRDRARIFEYALGSAREAITWCDAGAPVLGSRIVQQRLGTLEEIRRLLLAVIPRERDRLIRPSAS